MKSNLAWLLMVGMLASGCAGTNANTAPATGANAATSANATTTGATATKDASARRLITDYYAAYEKKDWNLMVPILADNFTFSSPAGDDHIDLKTYKERCWPNALKTKKFDLEKVMVDGDDAFVTYNGQTTDGHQFRNTERFKFSRGKIVENECFFGPGVSFPNNVK